MNNPQPGMFVFIEWSRVNNVRIGARVDRVSPVTDMVYLTDAAGSDRVCFPEELTPSPKPFDIREPARQGQSQHRAAPIAVDYKAVALKRQEALRSRNPHLMPLLEAAKLIGCAKSLLSRAAALGELEVTRSPRGRAMGVTEAEARRWERERNRKPGPKA